MSQTEYLHVAVIDLLGQQLVRIDTRGVEERGAIDAVEVVVRQDVPLKEFQDACRHILVEGIDDQVAFRLEGLLFELFAKLVV